MPDLDHIEAVALAADADGREWEWGGRYPQRVTRTGDAVLVADCFEDPDAPSRLAEFIATCDPPTVLALLEIARAAGETARLYPYEGRLCREALAWAVGEDGKHA